MKKATLIPLILLWIFSFNAKAADVSDLQYFNNGFFIIIEDCDFDAEGELIIPSTIEGVPVTRIVQYAFQNARKLTNIVIPNSISVIERGAFRGCSKITKFVIPPSVTTIEDSAFSSCSNLIEIPIPDSVTEIGSSCFSGCSNLESVRLPIHMTKLPNSFFSGCSKLKSVDGFMRLSEIGSGSFSGCLDFAANDFNISHLKIISTAAFRGCRKLRTVILGDSLEKVNSWIFEDCDALLSVTLGENVSSFTALAFNGCDALEFIYFKGNAPPVSTIFPPQITAPKAKVYVTLEAEGFGETYLGVPVIIQEQEIVDSDNDGVPDDTDAFPNDPNETADSDNDGVGDNADSRSGEVIAALQAQIDDLSTRPTLTQITDARSGSIVINSDNGTATITFTIEESEDLKTWQKTGDEISKTI